MTWVFAVYGLIMVLGCLASGFGGAWLVWRCLRADNLVRRELNTNEIAALSDDDAPDAEFASWEKPDLRPEPSEDEPRLSTLEELKQGYKELHEELL